MKKYTILPLLLFPLITACNNSTLQDEEEDDTSASISYSADTACYSLSPSITELTITGLTEGQEVYLIKTNPTSSALSSSYAQYVSSASGIQLSDAESNESTTTSSPPQMPGGGMRSFIPNQSFNKYAKLDLSTTEISSARSVSAVGTTVTQLSHETGITKELYIDKDTDISTFEKQSATLYYAGDYCNVWIIDDYYSDTDTDDKVSSSLAESIGKKFDSIYTLVREIFGDESNNIYYYYSGSSFTTAQMDYLSDTGTYVNIVLYDIASDSSTNSTGIVGYFYAKDYYPDETDIETISGYNYTTGDARIYSNEGKYFYVDSYYANNYLNTVYSTLSHEFQHMIDFAQKTINNNLSSSTNYNEMLSMLGEDLIQGYLEIDNDSSPISRLPMFDRGYRYVGLEYNSNSTYYTLLSYSNNYAFGAWLMRKFGGKSLVKEISTNSYTDISSIICAINSINGTSYSINDILALYAQSCLYESSAYTMNKESNYTLGDVSYTLQGIDLWNLDDMLSSDFSSTYSSSTYYKYDGCKLYGYNACYDIRPYGMTLVDIGTASSDTAVIYMGNSSASLSQELYIVIE